MTGENYRPALEASGRIQLLVRAIALRAAAFAASPPDVGHVSAIATDDFATLTTRLTRFIGGELVRCPLLVSGTATFSRDLSLLLPIH